MPVACFRPALARRAATLVACLLLAGLAAVLPARAARADYMHPVVSMDTVVVPMVFPVIGDVSYTDSFLASRFGGARPHYAQDLMGTKMEPLVAPFAGVISSIQREQAVGDGNYLAIRGANGWSVTYLHINNDTPGTDDGKGTANYAFAPGLYEGMPVVPGQLVGWLGDSGNAETTAPHLHIELYKGEAWNGVIYNPLASLNVAQRLSGPATPGPHVDGTLLQAPGSAPVLLQHGKARPVRDLAVLATYGLNVGDIVTVSPAEISGYPAGQPLLAREGSVVSDGQALWMVQGSTRSPVTRAQLDSWGLGAASITRLSSGDLADLPRTKTAVLPMHKGALVRSLVDHRLWLLHAGTRQYVPSAAIAVSQHFDGRNVQLVANPAALMALPAGPPVAFREGTLVTVSETHLTGVISGGMLHGFAANGYEGRYGYQVLHHESVHQADLAALSRGAVLGVPVANSYGR